MATAPFGFLRVGAACPPVRVADPAWNVEQALRFVAEARDQGVQVLALPELALTGYTCGDLFFSLDTLVGGAERALARLIEASAAHPMLVAVGLPVAADGLLFNCAALVQSGRLLGVVPKTYLPGYKEYYEERWFSSAREARSGEVRLAGSPAPFGPRQIFTLPEEPRVCVAVEICEDLWAPVPPSSLHAVAGATVILNLSSSNELVAKVDFRRELVKQQSARGLCGYVYANTGVHESTTDVVFGGHLVIAENGTLLAEGERFKRAGDLIVTEIDTERLGVERARQTSFADGVHALPGGYRVTPLQPMPAEKKRRLVRAVEASPFVPQDAATLDQRCEDIFAIQTAGLAKRLEHTGLKRVTLGLSGGLDSTLALLVCVKTFDLLGLPREGILAATMPGFGTTARTLGQARELARAMRVELREIDIQAAARQHIQDIGLDPQDRQSATYQNLQARERTQVLMDLANMEAGINVGTADLSEMALGFSTFAGDHISMYNVNAGVPKTLVKVLVRWVAAHRATGPERAVLEAVLETPISPELVPPGAKGDFGHRTEDIVGPYELHDFFLFCVLRLGAGPRKVLYLAEHAFGTKYDEATRRKWLRVFVTRFFAQQFKRSACPDGPKVGSVSLSPRGDWRMPSDASAQAWLSELDRG
jgi:NAD+ synthase (glutamine-hydrolysing)